MGRTATLWALAVVLLMTGWGVFLYRGLMPGQLTAADDFRVIYCSSRAWLYGVNPYEADRLDDMWLAARGPLIYRPSERGSRDLLYPPPTFVLLAPVAAFDWPVAREIWSWTNMAAIAISIFAIAWLAGMRWHHPSTWMFVGLAIAFAPCITGIKMGQLAMILTALVSLAHALRISGRPLAAGVLLGIAAMLKPQIGMVFLAYEIFRWRWSVAGPALAFAVLVTIAGIARLEVNGVPWLASLSANVKDFTTGIGNGNPLPENHLRYQMIDLRPVMHNLTPDRAIAALMTLGLAGLLGLGALIVWLRKQEDPRELLAMSIGASASLMIVYHRFYDASILLLPLGWVVWSLVSDGGKRFGWTRWAVLLGILPFFVPGAVFIEKMQRDGHVPTGLASNLLWDTFVVHHQAWALVWLTAALVLALSKCPLRASPAFAWLGKFVKTPRASNDADRPAVVGE